MSTTTHTARHRSGTLDGLVRTPHIALRLAPAELDEALASAHAEERTAGNFARLVYLMGLEQSRTQGYMAMPAGATVPQRSKWEAGTRLVHEKPIAVRLTAIETAELKTLAAREQKPAGSVVRVLYHMGMQVYRTTGRIALSKAPAATGICLN